MGFREQLTDKLKKKEAEIRGHENKIREARIYIQALQDMLRSLPEEGAVPDVVSTTDNVLRPGSMPHKTYELLMKARKPLHISVILKGIGEEPTRQKKASLVSSLAMYVKNQQIFTRPLPNTFGLMGMTDIPDPTDEPPEDFGVLQDDEDIPL